MKRNLFTMLSVTLFSAILVTMFISAIVTFLSMEDKSIFFHVWPKNWLVASIVGFFAILTMRPVAIRISNLIASLIYGKKQKLD